ncbi:MAG: hypothetical protein ABIH23_07170 [bacterium]
MPWFKRERPISDEELLARGNPLLKPGEWQDMLDSRRSLHHKRSVSTSREYRKDLKFIVLGAVLGAIVVGLLSLWATGLYVWRIEGYGTPESEGFSMIDAPTRSMLPIFKNAAWAGVVGGFVLFLVRRFWRRR